MATGREAEDNGWAGLVMTIRVGGRVIEDVNPGAVPNRTTGMPERHDSLEMQRAEFARSPFLAMPVAGAIAWTAIGVAGYVLPVNLAAWALFIGTGMIFSLGLLVARFTGEDLLGKSRPGNTFDALFMRSVVMAWLVFAIAIPFFRLDPTSLPLTIGILAGLMWLPFGWIIQHWVGTFHAVARTVLCLVAWYAWPAQRFVAIPAVIVGVYVVTLMALRQRQLRLQGATARDLSVTA